MSKPPTLSDNASWLLNAGMDDMHRRLKDMTGTPQDLADLQAAIDHETAQPKLSQRISRLKPIQAKLRKFRVTTTEVEVVTDSQFNTAATAAPSIPELNSLHLEATTAAEQARQLGEFATRKAIILGLKLAQLKEATPHGQWEALFTSGENGRSANRKHVSDLIQFDVRTARNYIAVAANLMAQRLSSEQSAALMQLASSPTQDLQPAEIQFLEDLMPERSLRRLYIHLNIIKPTVRELRAMEELPLRSPKEKSTTPPTLAEIEQAKNEHARKFWYGTPDPGMIEPDSLHHNLMDEARDPIKAHLRRLRRQDILEIQTTLQDLLQLTRLLLSNA